MVERILGKDEVTGSIPVSGSSMRSERWEVRSENKTEFPKAKFFHNLTSNISLLITQYGGVAQLARAYGSYP